MLNHNVKNYIEHELQYSSPQELYHYNCAQSILHGANDYYKIGLNAKALKIIAPFGGGMFTEKTCGMLTGGIAAIGALFAEDMPTQNSKLKEITCLWIQQFESEFKSTNCSRIKGINLKDHERCAHLILKAADMLQQVVEMHKSDITL